jgi:hypothetical protein
MGHSLIVGGQTSNYKELYHYTNQRLIMIPTGYYWTEYRTDRAADAKVMTGSTNIFNFRITVLVNNNTIDTFFADVATKWGPPGYGAAQEFRNKTDIGFKYFSIDEIS